MEKKTNKSWKKTAKEIITNKDVIFSIFITLSLLIFFHICSSITIPGISLPAGYSTQGNSFVSIMNLLAGGGLSKLSLFAMGVSPYITAQIIVQLLSSDLIPPLSKLAKTGERGKRKLEILTRFLTIPFCLIQGYAILSSILSNHSSESGSISIFGKDSLSALNVGEVMSILLIFLGGTFVCIFLGDIITKRGVGNGITLLILSGIVGSIIPDFRYAFNNIGSKINPDSNAYNLVVGLTFLAYILFYIILFISIIFVNAAVRKIPIQQTGQGFTQKVDELSFLPIKLNPSGVVPVIFSSSLITIPATISQFLPEGSAKWSIQQIFSLSSWWGLVIYAFFIIFFSFFYSYVQINPEQMAENFEKSNKFIPGIKNGEDTEKHISKILWRVNWIGAPFLALVAVAPYALSIITGISIGVSLGGTSIIIIVSGAIELWYSIKSASTTSGYNISKNKIKNANKNNDTIGLW